MKDHAQNHERRGETVGRVEDGLVVKALRSLITLIQVCILGENDSEEENAIEPGPSGSTTPKPRPHICTHPGCGKSYLKPSRLAEHQRSHTGERPFECSTCSKSYLRETHLQAHTRSYLPESERPSACSEDNCNKRFWTGQHLNVHIAKVHHGEKPFSCTHSGCEETFAKHNQLRRHIAEAHCSPGTKPYLCPAEGCTKSFSTNQKLRKHSKVHEENRYACMDESCSLPSSSNAMSPLYFSTWTALQAHLREKHPPTCPYPECKGRVFASQKGLKGHLKVHADKEIENGLEEAVKEEERPVKRRRGGEVGRDWVCEVENCPKAFKSKKALATHHKVTHLGRKDFVCSIAECGQTFGYKHLLQRHTARVHTTAEGLSAENDATSSSEDEEPTKAIGWMTGKDYSAASAHRNSRRALLPCPWPNGFESEENIGQCSYLFNRAYDLRRHLKTDHGLELSKDEVDCWAEDWRSKHPNPS
ncbi:hypothetical protein M422DRAFT_166865 [Sphaerobolus stellatus SS14]|uniref:C2H2-type domain-containing protein n=1 Tax=Sphaerobolus stellatus (strain SS14) TaxID=990650 RepID=A0A0C9VE87_SPHS4|nr:hypothetical protein M422DRAFT_166865 [Sphaerobolus stellatus SS14]